MTRGDRYLKRLQGITHLRTMRAISWELFEQLRAILDADWANAAHAVLPMHNGRN